MSIYAIGDLHFSTVNPKPMDVFGAEWTDHAGKILTAWSSHVLRDDIVLIPGDISWAMRLPEAAPDIELLADLPGEKVFIRGNHDFWWTSASKVRECFKRYPNMHFVSSDSVELGGFAFAGTRGWLCPQNSEYKKTTDEVIYNRELSRLENSLMTVRDGVPIIAMIHYPPIYEAIRNTGFTELFEKYKVSHVVYGHLHSVACSTRFEGEQNGVQYTLCSSDFLHFVPRLIH